MLLQSPYKVGLDGLAILTGTFAAGAMADLAMLTCPILLQTSNSATLLTDQWALVYHYGKLLYPGVFSGTTALLYLASAFKRRNAGQRWGVFAAAAAATMTALPWTIFIMMPTNNRLFEIQAANQAGRVAPLEEVKRLVTLWTKLHAVRCIFPLAGAVIGLLGKLQILVF